MSQFLKNGHAVLNSRWNNQQSGVTSPLTGESQGQWLAQARLWAFLELHSSMAPHPLSGIRWVMPHRAALPTPFSPNGRVCGFCEWPCQFRALRRFTMRNSPPEIHCLRRDRWKLVSKAMSHRYPHTHPQNAGWCPQAVRLFTALCYTMILQPISSLGGVALPLFNWICLVAK